MLPELHTVGHKSAHATERADDYAAAQIAWGLKFIQGRTGTHVTPGTTKPTDGWYGRQPGTTRTDLAGERF
jgi:hypothetical protein